jgi:hypothetical protein
MQEAHLDILLHTEFITRDGERIGAAFHIDKSTRQALEGA